MNKINNETNGKNIREQSSEWIYGHQNVGENPIHTENIVSKFRFWNQTTTYDRENNKKKNEIGIK